MKLPTNFDLIVPPFGKFQEESIGFGIIQENPGLLLDMGLGKTYVALNIARYRIQHNNVNKVLAVAPVSIIDKWLGEIHKFTEYRGISLHNPIRKKRIEQIRDFAKFKEIKFGVINWEGLYPFFRYLSYIPIDIIIADESARYMKNLKQFAPGKYDGTQRALGIVGLGDNARFRMILTGQLITKYPMDIWSQFRFKDKGATFGNNFYAWRNYFFEKYEHGGYERYVLNRERANRLTAGIYKSCIRFKKEDVLENIPKKMHITLAVPLEGRLKKEYNEVKRSVIAELQTVEGDVSLNIENVFTKYIRLQQITSGFTKNELGEYVTLKNTPKLTMLIEEIENILDAKESFIVWCRFLYSISLIKDTLKKKGIPVITMTGSDKNKTELWRKFQTSNIPGFVGQIVAGGIGTELFKENTSDEYQHTLLYENTFVLDHRLQAIDRSYGRIGQKAKARVVDLVIKDTIDEKILNVLNQDKEISDIIMEKGAINFIK